MTVKGATLVRIAIVKTVFVFGRISVISMSSLWSKFRLFGVKKGYVSFNSSVSNLKTAQRYGILRLLK